MKIVKNIIVIKGFDKYFIYTRLSVFYIKIVVWSVGDSFLIPNSPFQSPVG